MMDRNRVGVGLAMVLAIALSGCGGGKRVAVGTPPPATANAADVDAILALLDQGDEKAARKRIDAGLKRDPMNASILVLRDSVKGDPKELLGPQSYPYTVRAGETMDALAQRFLGNRLKAYQLARYNGVSKPASLVAGQILRIPGEPARVEPIRRAEPVSRPAPSATGTTPRAKVVAKPAAPMPPASNPAAARQARAAGLAALNQGKVASAVAQLRRAIALDPGNPVIAKDLARAQRIAATVRARGKAM